MGEEFLGKCKLALLSVVLVLASTFALFPVLAAEPKSQVTIITVNDNNGPVSGVNLLIVSNPSYHYKDGNPAIQITTTTAETTVKLPPGEYWFYAEKRGVGTGTKTLQIKGGETIKLVLNPLVKGIWTDPITGKKYKDPATLEEYPNWMPKSPQEIDEQSVWQPERMSIQGVPPPPPPRWYIKETRYSNWQYTDDPIGAIFTCQNLDVKLHLRLWEKEEHVWKINGGPLQVNGYTEIESSAIYHMSTVSNGSSYYIYREQQWVYRYWEYGRYYLGRWFYCGQWKEEWSLYNIQGDYLYAGTPNVNDYSWASYSTIGTDQNEPYQSVDYHFSQIDGGYLGYGFSIHWYQSWHSGSFTVPIAGWSAKSTSESGLTVMYECTLWGYNHHVTVYEATYNGQGTWILRFVLDY